MSKIPQGFGTITPSLIVNDAAAALSLYAKAFGGKEEYRMPGANGKIMHSCMQIGDSKIFVYDACPEMGAVLSTSTFYLYVEDVDASFKKAAAAGLKVLNQPQDMFYGDRCGGLRDEFGITWCLATHIRDVSPQELMEGAKKFAAKGA